MQWPDGRLFCGGLHCRVCGEWVLDAPLAYNGVVDECFKFSITMLLNSTIMLMIVLHYASICSYASILLLCSKLCQHNSPRPTGSERGLDTRLVFTVQLVEKSPRGPFWKVGGPKSPCPPLISPPLNYTNFLGQETLLLWLALTLKGRLHHSLYEPCTARGYTEAMRNRLKFGWACWQIG